MLMLLSTKCGECLFSPERIVDPRRMAQIVKTCTAKDQHFICHKATIAGTEEMTVKEYICRQCQFYTNDGVVALWHETTAGHVRRPTAHVEVREVADPTPAPRDPDRFVEVDRHVHRVEREP